jgi:dTMP kinase
MERSDPGILIAVEGIDGAGKTTQVEFLTALLGRAGEVVTRSKEPTDGFWGQQIRRSAKNGRMSVEDELHAFMEDRREHLRNRIVPALSRGHIVVLDRYMYSTIAYQGSRGGNVDSISQKVLPSAPHPDAVILLDVPPEIGLLRIRQGRDESPNAFEDHANLQAVRECFLAIARADQSIAVIDGTPSAEAVSRQILRLLLDGVLYKKRCAKPWGCGDVFNCAYRLTGQCRWAALVKLAYPADPTTPSPATSVT